jgi:hypothetical protein
MSRLLPVLMLCAMSLPGLAAGQEKVPLPEEPHINEQLIAAQAGDILRNICPKASARMLVVWAKMWDLKTYAEDKGYTESEVKAFLKDKDQKARVKAAAEAYLEAAGAVAGDPESYCQVGRDEIAKGTLLGQIIRVSP